MSEKSSYNMLENILEPQGDNFTPPSRTPWGGYRIVEKYKRAQGINYDEIVGESWEISGHPSFPNIFINEDGEKVSILDLEKQRPQDIYGSNNTKMPFLLKLLNSGSWQDARQRLQHILEAYDISILAPKTLSKLNINSWEDLLNKNNHELHCALKIVADEIGDDGISTLHQDMLSKNLSVQVHPKKGDYPDKPSKTEAWLILETEKGSGIYLGLKENISQEKFSKAMADEEDLSIYLNFVEVRQGEVYFIPSGTMHAIGAGLLLLEPQETSETTFRAYDWGRLQNDKPRQLHIKETVKVNNWDDRRGSSLIKKLRLKPKNSQGHYQQLLESDEFQIFRLKFKNINESQSFDTQKTKLHGWIVTEGSAEIYTQNNPDNKKIFASGQSIIIPAKLGKYTIRALASHTVLIEAT